MLFRSRPTYAGNAIATLQSTDAVKVVTVRPTAFPKPAAGGSGKTENIKAEAGFGTLSVSSCIWGLYGNMCTLWLFFCSLLRLSSTDACLLALDAVKFGSREVVKSDRPKLEDAKIVVSGGRSLKTK